MKFIGDLYPVSRDFYNIFRTVFDFLLIYKAFYFLIGLFFTRKFKKAQNNHKYAILIAARNERNVIGNLLDSINKQDYPKELISIFVVADNCTDDTADICRKMGAVVYERFDNVHCTKGYALEFLLDNIEKDYGRMNYEGYFIFDADNLLNKDYISKMNNAFDSGEKIITSYRNTKNFDENWISSNYALHWIRSIRMNHRARSVLRLATNIQGTGFLFANEIVKDGWHYTSLTEDRALTADAVCQGYEITYQDEAMFYDEQPTSLRVALRQRLRWSKGHLQAFFQTGPYLFLNIFLGKKYIKTNWNKEKTERNKVLESIRHRFASFDTLMQLTPLSFIYLVLWLFISVILYSFKAYNLGITNVSLFQGSTWLSQILKSLFDIRININPGIDALFIGLIITIWFRILYRIGSYFVNIWLSLYLFIVEEARIKKISIKNKIKFILAWPIFDIIGRYTTYIALFMNVTWKPIPHNSKVTIEDVK